MPCAQTLGDEATGVRDNEIVRLELALSGLVLGRLPSNTGSYGVYMAKSGFHGACARIALQQGGQLPSGGSEPLLMT